MLLGEGPQTEVGTVGGIYLAQEHAMWIPRDKYQDKNFFWGVKQILTEKKNPQIKFIRSGEKNNVA